MFLAVQHADDHNATTQPGVMPTLLERSGDFSQSVEPSGRPLQIIDPATGQPFPGGVIPSSRISPQASALLGYYPRPNLLADGTGFNFQAPLITGTRQDLITTRLTQSINNRNQLIGTFAYQRTAIDQTTIFGFEDQSVTSGVDTSADLDPSRQPVPVDALQVSVHRADDERDAVFSRTASNVSGDAGITGNNQEPVNWGPPSLVFSSYHRAHRRAAGVHAQPDQRRGLSRATSAAAGTTSRSAAICGATASTSSRSRIRAARSRSRAG